MADVLCVQVNHRGGLRLSVESDQVRVQTQWSKCIIPNPGTCTFVRIINKKQLSHSVIRAFFSFRHHRLPTATARPNPNPNPSSRLNSQPNPISNHKRFGLGAFPDDDDDHSRSRKGSQPMVQRAPLHPCLPQVSLQPRRVDDNDCM